MAAGANPAQSGATSLVVFLRTASGLPSRRWMLQEAAHHLLQHEVETRVMHNAQPCPRPLSGGAVILLSASAIPAAVKVRPRLTWGVRRR